MSKRILIVGGTRFVGPKLIELLLQEGDQITVFSRGNLYGSRVDSRVTQIRGDREQEGGFKQLAKQRFNHVYDMCCYTKDHALGLVRQLGRCMDHVIFFSTAAVYRKPLIYPLDENEPLGEWPSFGDYGVHKAEAEEVFIKFARDYDKKVTIFRPVYLLGRNNYFDRENYYFSRILANEPILMPGTGQALVQFSFLEEVAEVFKIVPREQLEQIEILNIGGDEYIPIRGFIKLCGKIAQKKPSIVNLDLSKFNLEEERFYDDLYPFPNVSLVVSNNRIKSLYHIAFEELEKGLSDIFAYWQKNWDGKITKSPREQQFLNKMQL